MGRERKKKKTRLIISPFTRLGLLPRVVGADWFLLWEPMMEFWVLRSHRVLSSRWRDKDYRNELFFLMVDIKLKPFLKKGKYSAHADTYYMFYITETATWTFPFR